MDNESLFIKNIKSNFSLHIRDRGDDYYNGGALYCTFKDATKISFLVKGRRNYSLNFSKPLKHDPSTLKISCTCPYFETDYCKHAWAGVRYIDAHVQEFLTNGDPKGPFKNKTATAQVTPPEPRSLSSFKKLVEAQQVYAPHEEADPLHRLAQKKRQVFYVIESGRQMHDPASPLKVLLCQKELLKSGKWGALKELKLPMHNWEAYVNLEDQVVLKKLFSLGALEEDKLYWSGDRNLFGALIPHAYFNETFRVLVLTKRFLIDRGYKTSVVETFINASLKLKVSEENGSFTISPLFCNKKTGEIFKLDSNLEVFSLSLHISSNSELISIENFNLADFAASLHNSPVNIPGENLDDLKSYLFKTFPTKDLILPEGWERGLEKTVLAPRLLIEDSRLEGEVQASIFTQIDFLYIDEDGEKINHMPLELDAEKVWLDKIESFESWSWLSREDKVGYFKVKNLEDLLLELIESGWELVVDKSVLRPAQNSQFKIVSSGTDWFDLQTEVSFGEEIFDVEDLLKSIRNNSQFIRLKSGDSGMLPKELVHKLKSVASFLQKKDSKLGFHASQTFFLPEFIEEETDSSFKTKVKDFQNIKNLKKEKNPASFSGNLHDYQKEGVSWLKNLHDSSFSGCLADDMGLGKTVQVLAFLQALKNKSSRSKTDHSKPHLIVVPKSLLHNWQEEASKFTKKIKVLEYSAKDRADYISEFKNYDIIILTYGILLRDVYKLEEVEFSYLILDEAQAIKNRSAKIYRAVRMLKTEKRLALTGTPVENHVDDLINIFDFLNPGMIGPKLRDDVNGRSLYDIQDTSIELLQKGLSPLILRRKKEDVLLDLPSKVETYLYADFSKKQKSLYDSLKLHYRESLKKNVDENGFKKSKMHVLEALLRLRQVSCHPSLIEGQKGTSDKVDLLVEKVWELCSQGKSVLVFSQFVKLLELVKIELNKKKVPFYYLDGKTKNRKNVVSEFQEQTKGAAFLISLKAGGVGLNLTNASYCFLLDPWWNPAVESQAVDRAHRIGQKNTVFTYRMVTRGSVEEKILELQKQKTNISKALIDGSASGLKSFTWSDVQELLE